MSRKEKFFKLVAILLLFNHQQQKHCPRRFRTLVPLRFVIVQLVLVLPQTI